MRSRTVIVGFSVEVHCHHLLWSSLSLLLLCLTVVVSSWMTRLVVDGLVGDYENRSIPMIRFCSQSRRNQS